MGGLLNAAIQPVADVVTIIEQNTPSYGCRVSEFEAKANFNNFICKNNKTIDHDKIDSYFNCIASLLLINMTCEGLCPDLDLDEIGETFADCEWCTENYGCFQVGGPFISKCHPISLPPQPEPCLDLKLQLYTPKNPETPQLLNTNLSNINTTNFDLKEKTIFLVGGWQEGDFKPYDTMLINAILNGTKQNVILFNWLKGSATFYGQAVANTRLLGRILATIINNLKGKLKYSPSMVYIVGHSAGAQLAGHAGEEVSNIRRITGLDPAGPYFNCEDAKVRLDFTDADFVDIIHTNAGGLGTIMPSGHIDFWPNGGRMQEGCDLIRRLIVKTSLNDKLFCDHTLSVYFFASSMYTETPSGNCEYKAHMCKNFEDFKEGKCDDCGGNGSQCARMGWFADQYLIDGNQLPAEKPFYLKTITDSPYC